MGWVAKSSQIERQEANIFQKRLFGFRVTIVE